MKTARSFLALIFITALLIGLCIAPIANVSAAPTNPGTTNLIAWWSMDETSGTRYDSHSSNNLTDNNTVGYETGIINNSANFVSTNSEYLSKSSTTDLQNGNNSWTLNMWAYISSNPAGVQGIFSKDEESVNKREYRITLGTTGKILFYIFDSGGSEATYLESTTTLNTNAWNFVSIKKDLAVGTYGTLYIQINDESPKTKTLTDYYNAEGSGLLAIGSIKGSGYYFTGRLDEISFYKRALSQDEITWLLNSGSGRTYGDLAPPTETPTNTATETATASNTPTYTATFTTTATSTATDTLTPSITPTFTATATDTLTPSPTATDTVTPTPSRTSTPTRTPGGPGMPDLAWDGTITYGDFSTTVTNAALCGIVILIGLGGLLLSTLQRKKNVK
jgi:hypothetical protein